MSRLVETRGEETKPYKLLSIKIVTVCKNRLCQWSNPLVRIRNFLLPIQLIEREPRWTALVFPLLSVNRFINGDGAAFSLLPKAAGYRWLRPHPAASLRSLPPLSKVERGNEHLAQHGSEWGGVQKENVPHLINYKR